LTTAIRLISHSPSIVVNMAVGTVSAGPAGAGTNPDRFGDEPRRDVLAAPPIRSHRENANKA